VEIRYPLGFEPIVRDALGRFANLGLRPIFARAPVSMFSDRDFYKLGYTGSYPNQQAEYDHKDDRALFISPTYFDRRFCALQDAYRLFQKNAADYAGPAVLESFGEDLFTPQEAKGAIGLTASQKEQSLAFTTGTANLRREYIKEEERSYTILALPSPQIGEPFMQILEDFIRINTLDYALYQRIQQTIIDVLDQAISCEVRGSGSNQTNLRIALHPLQDPASQSLFENCVADVNIPVGEVFTSPLLKGTNGILHVEEVVLNSLLYKELRLTFQDGWVTEYTCANFTNEQKNRDFILENLLHLHKTLPIGEFAIGTNTLAYVTAKRYHIADKLPILIAEKMGPHFAVGDTCYSHTEDVAVYNPDGKELIARDNEASLLRKSEQADKAYFNCHTDITIPYDAVGELTAILPNETRIPILQNGRFVLQGCESLNQYFLGARSTPSVS
jgi:hypothetical protein